MSNAADRRPANHFEIGGAGIEGVIDLTGILGASTVSLVVDGRAVREPQLEVTPRGIVVEGTVEEVPDDHVLSVSVTVAETNLEPGSAAATSAGFAVLVTARTSIGGPGLVAGPLELFELRPLAVTCSFVQT